MVCIYPKISCYHINIDPKFTPYKQKMIALNLARHKTLKEKLEKLITKGFIREVIYSK